MYLRQIRQPYLSTSAPPHRSRVQAVANGPNGARTPQARTHFTDAVRDQIDADCKVTLRDLNLGIRQLEDVERIRCETQVQLNHKRRGRNGFRFLSSWAAGDSGEVAKSDEERLEDAREVGLRAHRESVVWYLRRQLEAAAEAQREMMETRVEREIEKSKSVLYKAKDTARSPRKPNSGSASQGFNYGPQGAPVKSEGTAALSSEVDSTTASNCLTPEQIQLFEEENSDLLRHYEDTLDQVRSVLTARPIFALLLTASGLLNDQ